MTDKIISDDEKNALLEGVESGDVEVHSSSGPRYATVEPFEIVPRNHIVSNSFPRLQKLNRSFAAASGKSASVLLNEKVDVLPGPIEAGTWGEFMARSASPAILFEFSANPLSGSAVVVIESDLVRQVVESFYGGTKSRTGRRNSGDFTPGEMNVTALLCEGFMQALASSWRGLVQLKPQRAGIHKSSDAEVLENGAGILCCRFDVQFGEEHFRFCLVWPSQMLAPLLPVLEGQKQNRDAAEDARWEQVIRSRLPEATVGLTSCIGRAQLPLRRIVDLVPGEIIDLEYPRQGTVFAAQVPVLEGRFGVHDGRYAIEADRWLTDGSALRHNR